TLKKYYGPLMQIAVLEQRYNDALSYLQKMNTLEDKPAAKAMTGLLHHPLIDAKKAGEGQAQVIFEAEFKERLQKLPYEVVQNEVKEMKSRFEIISSNLLAGLIEQQYDTLALVVTGIRDVGVDPSVFPGRMWVNKKEIPDNGKDDDWNGYIDDVYGIGWTWYGKKDVGLLRKLNVTQAQIATDKQYLKGLI